MNDKEIKALLKQACPIRPSAAERQFLRRYERRSLRLWELFGLELRYMGPSSCLGGALLLVFLWLVAKTDLPELIWYVSGILPVTVLVLLSWLGRSRRYGMEELEAATRFSLKFIKLIRLLILGTVSLIFLVIVSLLIREKAGFHLLTVLGLVGTPFLLNLWGNLLILRKWHDGRNLLGCLAVTAFSCLLPLLLKQAAHPSAAEPGALLLILGTALTVRESILYIKESEDLSWSFCLTV